MVDRALEGIEWLMDRARSPGVTAEPVAANAEVDALLGWLVEAGGATGEHRDEFTDHLAAAGYTYRDLALSSWLAEAGLVLSAARASGHSETPRSIREIEAELSSLPTVPLNEEDAALRHELRTELSYATFSAEERREGHRAEIVLEDLEDLATQGEP